MRVTRYIAATATALIAGVLLVSPVSAKPSGTDSGGTGATAAACRSHPHSAKDNSEGGPSKSSVPIRYDGPYADCFIDGYVSSGTRLVYHCYTVNDYGNTWTWVRVPGTDIVGWVWDSNLVGNGSYVPC